MGELLDLVEAAVEHVRGLNRLLASMDALPPDELIAVAEHVAELGLLHGGTLVATARALEVRSEGVDAEHSVARRCGAGSSTELLARLTGRRHRGVRQLTRLAHLTATRPTLTGAEAPALFPTLGAALLAGTVSLDQADVIVDALLEPSGRAHPRDVEAAEVALVESAAGSRDGATPPISPELLAAQGRLWRDALDPDGAEPTFEEQHAARSFRLGQRDDGMWVGRLVCTPEQGESLRLVLDAHNAPRTAVRFRSAAENAEIAAATDDRTTAQRQCDALIGLVSRSAELHDSPRIGGDAPTLVVTVSPSDLQRASNDEPAVARLARHGDAVSTKVAARILCDGFVQAAFTDSKRHVLSLGRRTRLFTRAQRRAILVRDGGCTAPGCDKPPGFAETHHVIPWSHDGPTDTSNGIALCPFHHHEVHRGRLGITADMNGRWNVRSARPVRSRHGRGDGDDARLRDGAIVR